MDSLLLDLDNWDLVIDAANNIAVATNPYAIAQNVASAVRLFLGEQYYQPDKGIPYFRDILGHDAPIELVKSEIEQAALTVPDVESAKCYIASENGRTLTGQIQVTDINGTTTVVNLQ